MNIAVSFVFDTSGSMNWDLQGRETKKSGNESRMDILRKKSVIMIKDLAEIGNISVNLVASLLQQNIFNKIFLI